MRIVIAPLVVGVLLLTGPAYAQDEGRGSSTGGGKGALLGLLVGAGAAVVYAVSTDYCRNSVGEYTEQDQAKFCGVPIAAMVGGGTLAGYFIGRNGGRPRQASLQTRTHGHLASYEPTLRLRHPARTPRPEDRLFGRLFAATDERTDCHRPDVPC
jgi:hypothetical protein